MLQPVLTSQNDKSNAMDKLNKLIKDYSSVFDISLKKNIQVPHMKLRFRKDVQVTPYKCTSSRPIPFALRSAAKEEIEEQIRLGILGRVPPDAPIEWCASGMILEKDNLGRDVRLVVDSKEMNEFLERDAFPMQSARELVKQIPPTLKVFLSVDFYKGYYQIPLAPKDQLKTTFMLHSLGLFYMKRVPQGSKCSVDFFNRVTDDLVYNIPNCLKMVDDVLIHGATVDEVLTNLRKLLVKCKEKEFTLHPKKIAFGNRLKFAGYMVSDKGLSIDPKKVDAIRKFAKPDNVTNMKSFLGLAAQFQEACPNLMGTLKPLSDTTSHRITPAVDEKNKKLKNNKRIIDWNENLEEAFFKAKKLLTDADGQVLTPYDPNLPLIIYTDACRLEGFGWVAMQEKNGVRKLVECGSSTIPDAAKRNFSVSELELAAVEMALRKMRLMTLGNKNVQVKTDHQALVSIVKKPLEKIESKRLLKLVEKLQQYTFEIQYVEGIKNEIADALSRSPVFQHGKDEIDVANSIAIQQVEEYELNENVSVPLLDQMAKDDKNYQLIRQAITASTHPNDLPPDHPGRSYKADWHLLGTHNNLVTMGDRILVPKAARKDILRLVHKAHLGQKRTVALASNLYFWRGMPKEIIQLVEACELCQVNSRFHQKEELQQTIATRPMEMNSADLAEHARKYYLIHADRYTGFLWVYPLTKTTSSDVYNAMWRTFNQFGFPNTLRTDNGPQFVSDSFITYCKTSNIKQEFSSPYFPQSNGHAEKMVGVAKNMIKKSSNLKDLQQMVQLYNSTPNESKLSPAELMFGRKIRTALPILDSNLGRVSKSKIDEATEIKNRMRQKTKSYFDKSAKPLRKIAVGTSVRIYNVKTNQWDTTGSVVKIGQCGRSYQIKTQNNVFIFRNRRFIREFQPRKKIS